MPYYKTQQNKLHFLEDEKFEYLLPIDAVAISDKEALELTEKQEKLGGQY